MIDPGRVEMVLPLLLLELPRGSCSQLPLSRGLRMQGSPDKGIQGGGGSRHHGPRATVNGIFSLELRSWGGDPWS